MGKSKFLAVGLIALILAGGLVLAGCCSLAMQCRRVAFPALTAESIALLLFSAIMVTVIVMQKSHAPSETVRRYKI